jgi:hypothetical protein
VLQGRHISVKAPAKLEASRKQGGPHVPTLYVQIHAELVLPPFDPSIFSGNLTVTDANGIVVPLLGFPPAESEISFGLQFSVVSETFTLPPDFSTPKSVVIEFPANPALGFGPGAADFAPLTWTFVDVPDGFTIPSSTSPSTPPEPPPPPPPPPPTPQAVAEDIRQQDAPFNPDITYTTATIVHAGVAGGKIPSLFGATLPGLMDNDTGDGIQVTSYTQPKHGIISIGLNGDFTYTPNKFFYGDNDFTTSDDSFTYTITDSANETSKVTDNIFLRPIQSYIDDGAHQAAIDDQAVANFLPVADKQISDFQHTIDLANSGLADLKYEKIMFIAYQALPIAAGAIPDIGPALGLLTDAIQIAVEGNPPDGATTLQKLNGLLSAVADEVAKGGSVGHVASLIIKGVSKGDQIVSKSLDITEAITAPSPTISLQSITDLQNDIVGRLDTATAKQNAVFDQLNTLKDAAENAHSYDDAYVALQRQILAGATPN